MNKNHLAKRSFAVALMVQCFAFLVMPDPASATSQWARRTGMSCSTCHAGFPRLNAFGEEFLRNGYTTVSPRKVNEAYPEGFLDKVGNLVGFRLNMTPIMLETNALQEDSASSKSTRITLGNPIWIQFFIAGPIAKNISFFSELQYNEDRFHFSWFYFNFTNIGEQRWLNLNLGNISPMQFTSYPNRLRIYPAVRSEVMRIKTSNNGGDQSVDMSSVRPGIQYYGWNDYVIIYAGISPGTKPKNVDQFFDHWAGFTVQLPEDVISGFDGSSATLHYYGGTDTKGTGTAEQFENSFSRISPQLTIRYDEILDIQAAYVTAKDDNWTLSSPPTEVKYSGFALTASVIPVEEWEFGFHYDVYSADELAGGVKPIPDFHRVVPVIRFFFNQNISIGLYYEKDLTSTADKVDRIYFNVRTMF